MSKKVILSGITGQDGSYLAELLLNEGHKVYGIIRRSSSFNTGRLESIYNNPNLKLIYGDLSDSTIIAQIVGDVKPDFFYNLGAMSHVRVSFDIPEYTSDVTGVGVLRGLEAIQRFSPKTRFYQASSSELFGSSPPPQNEDSPFHPRSPYAIAKLMGYWVTVNYRESYGLFASNGILFNHESPRRGQTFVTRKITRALGRIKHGLQDKLVLGNLDAKRDWGHAKDYVEGMKRILETEHPSDFVLATGESHSVREFAEEAFNLVGLDPYKYIQQDPKYLRPAEVDHLLGDAEKAHAILDWYPKINFKQLVAEMVEHDMEKAQGEAFLKNYKMPSK